MSITDQGTPEPTRAGDRLARIPTGAKVFLILSCALLPLALIAFFASLQTNRASDMEARARLRIATEQGARALTIELVGDMTALRDAASALERDAANSPACARARGVFAQQFSTGTSFAITDRTGRLLCGDPIDAGSVASGPGRIGVRMRDNGLVLGIKGRGGNAVATAFFPTEFLAVVGRPSGFPTDYGSRLTAGPDTIELTSLPDQSTLRRRDTHIAPIGVPGLAMAMTISSPPITSPLLIAMLLPLLMWAAAAGIGWFVVDRLLIRPLRRLRANVGTYQPGEVLQPIQYGAMPAEEIRELGDTFEQITRTVQLHEADLAEGLVRQTKLTREVHHRVKNNLQVIASLINFHARGAPSPDAAAAYASIQRRVDALAVVHRYHFAEMEDNRGLELRSVIGELASNIRATAPDPGSRLGIALEIEPLQASQDVAVAVAFLLTELIELAMNVQPQTQIRLTMRAGEHDGTATLRVSSPSLVGGPTLDHLLATRYGRVITGLARQLRAPLHHDPLVGAYEISIAVMRA
ncbi:histidine kinase [Sphingomonas sp. S1-29]|uniref:sensor histidine kinase n=1 Tax=Sphingomonas sp. S1-29 TaxID=2991074 RepID=UPI00223F6EB4|nr:histidine kinase dimerization/phosphoacceptor domain -containing protein [Sphingomonas sp. S1-29]UZK70628.1 histidine kinase [Sphingomonas sp. S1-29]